MPRLTVPAERDGQAPLAVVGLGEFELERPAGRMVADFLRRVVLLEVKDPSMGIVGVLRIASDGDPGVEQKSVDHHRHRSACRKRWRHSRNRSFKVIVKPGFLPDRGTARPTSTLDIGARFQKAVLHSGVGVVIDIFQASERCRSKKAVLDH